ncbi:BMP family protein [Candidatus Poribacteria bacterium]|nr:BMP family protein [Candidatus Poribacteria bacterium]
MIQISYKLRNNVAIHTLLLGIFISGLMLIGSMNLEAKEHEKFKVAMLLPGSISDAGWNALAYEGLKAIEKQLGAEISHAETRTPTDQEEQFRSYALDGYNMVFGHGYEFQDPAKAVAPDFPETIFITSSGGTITDNISPVNFRVEQAAYLLGMIAGEMTQTNKLGVMGGQNIPSVNSTFMAFEGGAKSVNPEIEVSWVYVGNWEDIGKGKELALAQINEGVDFIFPNADAAGLGAYEAAEIFNKSETAEKEGRMVYTFGANRDKSDISPTVIANAVITPNAFVKIAKIIKEDKFKPQIYTFNMLTDEAITLTYNPALKDKVPMAVQKAVEDAKAKILAGELKVPQIDFSEEE